MLPKFRPATLGREALARPSIRPVRPSPPPPPPSPPRKFPSGFGPKGGAAAIEASHQEEPEPPTAVGSNGEPSTLSRGPETVPQTVPQTLPQEPNARRGRANAIKVTFDDETQARKVDDRVLDQLRGAPDLAVPYDSLPSLETPRPYDAYEEAFAERDPVTMLHGARESARVRRAKDVAFQPTELQPIYNPERAAFNEPSYKEPSYREPSYKEPSYKEPSYKEPSYKEPSYKEPSYKEPASFKEPSYKEPAPFSEPARKEPSYREPASYRDDSYDAHLAPSYPAPAHANDQEFFPPPRREESGPRSRPRPSPVPAARSYAAPAPSYDDAADDSAQWGRDPADPDDSWSPPAPSAPPAYEQKQPIIPPAPRVPNELRPAFVVGVQPLRGAAPDAWGIPRPPTPGSGQRPMPSPMQAINASMPQPYAAQRAQVQYAPTQQQPQRAMPPAPAAPYAAAPYTPPPPAYAFAAPQRPPTPMPISQPPINPSAMNLPVGGQLTEPPAPAPKIGRFAWFIAGAAFGITFAFFATGVFNNTGKATKDDSFPAAAALPTVSAPAASALAPAASGAPAASATTPPVASLLSPPPPATPSTTPSATPAKPATPSKAEAPPPPPPKLAPARPRSTPRRPPPPDRPSVPKNIGGAQGGDDPPAAPAPAPAPASGGGGGGDLGDLLGAGLKP